MFPELFELPFVHVTVKSYGTMMVIGFLLSLVLMRHMARSMRQNPEHVTNLALYALVAGVIGARIFHVIHQFDSYRGNLLSVFAVWNGGLEFVGGVILATTVVFLYLKLGKLAIMTHVDILAAGLMLGLAFGRIGCLLNGCCYGAPTDKPCGISFPYASPAYISQVFPDKDRNRDKPLLELPDEFYGYLAADGKEWVQAEPEMKYYANLKPYDLLTDEQKHLVKSDHRCMPVHPSQLYSSANALILCGILYMFWRKFSANKPGSTFAMALILYGTTRFLLELTRDDNPFESAWWIIYKGGTISQNIGIYMTTAGIIVMIVIAKITAKPAGRADTRKRK